MAQRLLPRGLLTVLSSWIMLTVAHGRSQDGGSHRTQPLPKEYAVFACLGCIC
ncbi:MAG TPA: hypothetical protein VIO61_15160 [Anaerolineaceae bacterium]